MKNALYKSLNNEINIKHEHKKLFRVTENEKANIKMTSCWLKNANIRPREEASLCFLQDKNVFLENNNTCPHCGKANRTVDYLATKCDRMLGYDYVQRHNEVVRFIHLGLCKKYGFTTERN